MIALLDTNKIDEAEVEIGCQVEQLLTPLTRFSRVRPTAMFAVDNGAFSRFDRGRFLGLLERETGAKRLCRWVAVPDVPGSAIRTLEAFTHWSGLLRGWPLALVAQDGQEFLPIPWGKIEAVFIGGTTEWKLSPHAEQIIKAARVMGKWCHVGRVNTPGRWEHFERLGADSIDGSGLARFSRMRQAIADRHLSPELEFAPADPAL